MTAFNTYGCLWTPTSLTFYVNNQRSTMPYAHNPVAIGSGTPYPSAAAEAITVNLGIGYNWPAIFDYVHTRQ